MLIHCINILPTMLIHNKQANVGIVEKTDPVYPKIYLTKPTENGKTVDEIEYWTDMPSWPRTSRGGVAHLIQLHGVNVEHARKL
jgi:hypothetical protein